METLDHHTCYQAVSRRDARFDGRFYTAVTTTGIFCRPSCPARTPRSSNVRFFSHAAAASAAGFRPCRRCRPELAPGHPEWNRRADLTGRALRLIDTGMIERSGVVGLASRLGVSERHLRRELRATIGTGPLQLARARRLWLARLLLDQTNLSVTDVAHASGFGSLRQFNDSIRRAFDAPPSALRRRRGGLGDDTAVTLHLPCRGPLRWEGVHAFLAQRALPGLEEATADRFRRIVGGGWIELGPAAPGDDALVVTCALDQLSDLAEVLPRLRAVADLDTDLEVIERQLATDPDLGARLAADPLPRLPGVFDPFEVTVRAVVGQQVSVAAARTLLGRLLRIVSPGPPTGFPSPDEVAAADLGGLGIPRRRRATITALARAVADGAVVLDPDTAPDELRRQLQAVPGIGPWTAGYVAMRALSDPDGWPPGDLGLRRSLGVAPAELERRAERWRPWRAYAAVLLWHSDPTFAPPPATTPTDPDTTDPDTTDPDTTDPDTTEPDTRTT